MNASTFIPKGTFNIIILKERTRSTVKQHIFARVLISRILRTSRKLNAAKIIFSYYIHIEFNILAKLNSSQKSKNKALAKFDNCEIMLLYSSISNSLGGNVHSRLVISATEAG